MNDRTAAVAALVKAGAGLETRDDYLRTALVLCARERGQAPTGRFTDVAPVGGGGLLSGTALAVAAVCPRARVIAGEPERADDA